MGKDNQDLNKHEMSQDIPNIPTGGRSLGDGTPPLQIVIGVGWAKDCYVTAVFLIPYDENILLNQPREEGLKWEECWLCLCDSKYIDNKWKL